MRQILQNTRSGKLELTEVPAPSPSYGQILVRNHYSVVSPGTEKLALDFARMSLLGKARSRPDLVRQVVRKLRQEGPLPTYRAVTTRLEAPQPLGYSCAGVIEAIGPGVRSFTPGDRVACGGAGYANHAELVVVPENLVARIPDGLDLAHAAFATIGAIALQSLRIAEPVLGEVVAVIGLGLIGQITVQLLRANGCRVLGIDLDPTRVKQAMDQGAEWGTSASGPSPAWIDEVTGGHGVDLGVITASAQSSAPLQLAADLCRLRGRIVVVGALPMNLDRRTFYDKELELRMSRSYGPGRYDRAYEESGFEYPLPYVRWTENRNLQVFLELAAQRVLRLEQLDAETVPFSTAERVYEELANGARRSLAVLFRYVSDASSASMLTLPRRATRPSSVGVAFLGAGNYAKGMLLPTFANHSDVGRIAVVTATGASARRTAERFGFERCGTDPAAALDDPRVNLVVVATRHDSHATLAARALRAGKAVWLEKPIGLSPDEVEEVITAARESGALLAVGYNRRFSPHTRAIRAAFVGRTGPLNIHYTVSAGPSPRGTWVVDPTAGGGRIVGEVCHFIDLSTYLVAASPTSVFARSVSHDAALDDSTVASLGFPDGSVATIEYLARASTELPKERFEVSADGKTASCNNFRVTRILGGEGLKTLNQDKGQAVAVAEIIDVVRRGAASPFSLDELLGVSRATFAILESVRKGEAVRWI